MATCDILNESRDVSSERTEYDQVRTSGPLRGHSDISDEEGPWSKKCVLSFDGGGIRGYSSLLILKAIMTAIREIETEDPVYPVTSSFSYPWMGNEDTPVAQTSESTERVDTFLPCHYFDYMAGTSTGGLSSIMLGRLRMTVDEALDHYVAFGNDIFGKPRWFHERSILWYPRAKFSSRKTRVAFQKVVLKSLERDQDEADPHSAVTEPFKYRENRTRTMVISWSIKKRNGLPSVSRRYLWRSYEANFIVRAQGSDNWTPCIPHSTSAAPIWQVARATTAAPRYFESIKIDNRKFLDGGMTANNPSLVALKEFRALHNAVPFLFVSLGTGLRNAEEENRNARGNNAEDINQALRRAATIDDVRRKQWLKKYFEIGRHWTKSMVDCEGDEGTNGWWDYCDAIGLERRYRLNVRGNLAKMPLDEWRPANSGEETLETIKNLTEAYLADAKVRQNINQIAREAVDIRRERAMTQRWESFAVDVTYSCPVCISGAHLVDRNTLRGHLQESRQHNNPNRTPMTPEEVERTLNAGRHYIRATPS